MEKLKLLQGLRFRAWKRQWSRYRDLPTTGRCRKSLGGRCREGLGYLQGFGFGFSVQGFGVSSVEFTV